MFVMTKQNVTISMCLQTVLYNVLLEIRAQHLETTAELVSKLRPECEYTVHTEHRICIQNKVTMFVIVK